MYVKEVVPFPNFVDFSKNFGVLGWNHAVPFGYFGDFTGYN